MKRIELFDVWRSFAILLMIAYHLMYDLNMFGVLSDRVLWGDFAYAVRYVSAGSFIIISGAVTRYSRSSIKRGFTVFCAGCLVTVAMAVVGMKVQFGILHLLGTLMMAYGLISRYIKVPRGVWFPVLCALVFLLSFDFFRDIRVDQLWLYPIGFRYHGFSSADYYPLLPWGLLFAVGAWLGAFLEKHRDKKLLSRSFHPALTFAGRHSLLIYIIHQPVMYGICLLLFGGQ